MSAIKPVALNNHPTTCMLPWSSIAANTTGTTRPCCVSEDFINRAMSTDGSMFCIKMKQLDKLRNENFAETHPEIAKAMNYDAT